VRSMRREGSVSQDTTRLSPVLRTHIQTSHITSHLDVIYFDTFSEGYDGWSFFPFSCVSSVPRSDFSLRSLPQSSKPSSSTFPTSLPVPSLGSRSSMVSERRTLRSTMVRFSSLFYLLFPLPRLPRRRSNFHMVSSRLLSVHISLSLASSGSWSRKRRMVRPEDGGGSEGGGLEGCSKQVSPFLVYLSRLFARYAEG